MLLVLGVLVCGFVGAACAQTIKCSSDDGGRHYCQADTRNGVMLSQQISGSACQEGYSWGYDERGIWVDHGCRAEFTLQVAGQALYCASDDGGKHYCKADTSGTIVMVRQVSGSACQQGYSWGYDNRGIWVDHGCRANFATRSSQYAGGGNSMVRCSSDDGGRHYCRADTSGDVEMLKQRSHADCIQGSTWGYDGNGIWVDRGCRADFVVEPNERPWNGNGGGQMQPMQGQTISCSSDDGGKHYCNADTRGSVQLTKQRSTSACQEGYSWGYDGRGIWVDHGCRADFMTSAGGYNQGGGEYRGRACNRSVGEQRARELVEQCLQVSPGTHPPCNVQNSCRLITDEIRRSCELLGRDGPAFCDEYR